MPSMMQGSPVPPPAVPMPAPVPPSAGPLDPGRLASDLAVQTMQAQARDLTQRIDGALARRQKLIGELSQANGGQIDGLHAQIAQVDVTIAQLHTTLAAVNDRIAQIQLVNPRPIIVQPPPVPRFPMRSRDVQILTAFAIVFVCGVLTPIIVGFVRRRIRAQAPQTAPVSDPMMNARMERLEHAVDAIAIEVERISEGQRFVTKVLTQRSAQSSAATKDAPAEPAPFRALGAGPMEPIRPAERQSVRQSITPH